MPTATTGGSERPMDQSYGGAFQTRDVVTWSPSWPHQGHRLWASMPDAFWIYVFKVQLCPHRIGHEWKLCPYAHRGERARRRDPRRDPYMAVACPDYRASEAHHLLCGTGEAPRCVRGLACRYAHGVFELWLHPERFRTRMCDAGAACPRTICFFAHFPSQRRREDDPVPFDNVPVLPPPALRPPLLPPRGGPPPLSPRSPRVVAPASSLLRPGMMMQTRSGEKLPLHSCDDDGTSPSSSSTAIIADIPAPTTPSIVSGSASIGSGGGSSNRHHGYEDFDDFPHLDFIMDMLNGAKI